MKQSIVELNNLEVGRFVKIKDRRFAKERIGIILFKGVDTTIVVAYLNTFSYFNEGFYVAEYVNIYENQMNFILKVYPTNFTYQDCLSELNN